VKTKNPENTSGRQIIIQRRSADSSSFIRTFTVGSGITPDQPHCGSQALLPVRNRT
jgi:hypothetical protein